MKSVQRNRQRVDHAQPQVPFEVVKVAVVVEQFMAFLDAKGGDKRVNRVADCDAKLTQSTVILCRGDSQSATAGFEEYKLAERIHCLSEAFVAANAL
jgi:limonene-1,2-epoxide hydrolase